MSFQLNDLQFQILDSLYFVESFDHVVEEAGEPIPHVVDELRTLIDKGLVQVMSFDDSVQDYVRSSIFDTDNLNQYHFLATKQGLMLHNGQG
ncbi:hypothetical protein [Pontibacter sp. G13]|uniref:hypothetical protein n=1 Tax=Pontibacter sp. G13 TaxID=3074898 RepID=UPI00288C5CF8|nr:hypothetical protein [Pontibacter sp. G13]WNJ20150.1 hypothetical protein RJD25_06695 [Pontibacter sp. G13]